MSSDFPHTRGSADSPDQVIQETPVAGQIFPEASDASPNAPSSNKGDESDVLSSPQLYTPRPGKLNREVTNEWGSQSDINNTSQGKADKPVQFNKRTPNLDRIAKFFKDNRSPHREGLLQRFEASELEDTPVSERGKGTSRGHNICKSPLNGTSALRSNAEAIADSRYHNGNRGRASYLADVNGSPKDRKKGANWTITEQRSQSLDTNAREISRLRSDKNEKTAEQFVDNNLHETMVIHSQSAIIDERTNTKADSFVREVSPHQSPDFNIENGLSTIINDKKTLDTRLSGSSPLLNVPMTLLAERDDNQAAEDNALDNSRIDDTTEGNYSEMWVLRPNKNGIFNSNKSTQVINTAESQGHSKENVTGDDKFERQSFTEENNITQTQVISSYPTRNASSQQKNAVKFQTSGGELCSSTQIIQSPEHAFSNRLETPKGIPKNNFEPILEVPETSSPSKTNRNKIDGNSSPSPAEKDRNKVSFTTQVDHAQDAVRLQISTKPELTPSQDETNQLETTSNKDDAIVVLSEPDLTQELPEVEEATTQRTREILAKHVEENSDDQITINRRKRHGQTVELATEEENRSRKTSPRKKTRRSLAIRSSTSNLQSNETEHQPDMEVLINEKGNAENSMLFSESVAQRPMIELPNTIREQDDEYLSKEDIKFEDSVWCQYSLDYNYYPGRILSQDEQSDSCWVYFDTGKSLTKSDDIHYLDIRVGDTVNMGGKKHQVVALECRSSNMELIRCIRGYDTVHLRRRKKSGSFGQKVIIKPLAVINLDLNEWTKRPKIILEGGSHSRAKAFQGLQRPIRGRKSTTTTLSPRKSNHDGRAERTTRPIYKEDSDDDNEAELARDSAASQRSITAPDFLHVLGQPKKHEECKIFKNCIFVLTGLSEDRQDLSDVIESQGGDILNLGFSELFKFETLTDKWSDEGKYSLQLSWKEQAVSKSYRFACLITTKHLRSLKYLETLALGWPTLHWKFIRECLRRGRVCEESLYQYLLPAGESYRLAFDTVTKNGVIKSNNIFHFYLKLIRGSTLEAQIGAMKEAMSGHKVILYGQSELDQFIKFSLACLGVSDLYQLRGKITSTSLDNLHLLTDRLDELLKDKGDLNLLIYVNKNNGISSDLLENLREQLSIRYQSVPKERLSIHVESKEWLIQTIINGGPGFDE